MTGGFGAADTRSEDECAAVAVELSRVGTDSTENLGTAARDGPSDGIATTEFVVRRNFSPCRGDIPLRASGPTDRARMSRSTAADRRETPAVRARLRLRNSSRDR